MLIEQLKLSLNKTDVMVVGILLGGWQGLGHLALMRFSFPLSFCSTALGYSWLLCWILGWQ